MGFRILNWDDAWKAVLSIAIVIIIVFMLVDFISWRTALDIIKKEMPIEYQAQPYTFIKGYGYVPLLWRGNFKLFSVTTFGTAERIDEISYIVLQIGDHQAFWVNLKKGYGTYHAKNESENENDWYNQDFVDAEVYAKVDAIEIKEEIAKVKVLLFIETEEKHWIRIFNFNMQYKSCTKTWYGGWYK
jgi:hypothetical protein